MVVEAKTLAKCPACGSKLSRERWSEGLCPGCVFELALDDTSLEAELEVDPGDAPTLEFHPDHTFSEGEIQGERYRIRSLLGRGGMGEVWRAYDLKLRQDVALKALRTELVQDQQALEILRQEVRTAREVISPNVCRVFDLQELDGQELVSMEYIDGTTLNEILRERSPLDLNEAREIASQFLAGLEAIHDAGLVHRDIKPENVMVTRTGRVVVMDFGIAKGLQEGKGGVIAGTPAYMSPEQAGSGELDARSDLFSAGVVLAEMVAPGGIRSFEDRKRIWEGVHQETPQVPETPWAGVIRKAVSGECNQRFPSAASLARALEEVTLRAAGDEDADPYPGLASFTQDQAKFFYGRELEVEALWKKLRRPHLLALIAPSGSGKSSFLQAGLLPALPDDWSTILLTPGNRPFTALARGVAEVLDSDSEVVDELLRFEEPEVAVRLVSRWRQQHKHTLIIVDQFEELFAQNPSDAQERFAELLGQFPLETDTFVLLSMREDFFYHCQPFEALAPVFSELMPLGALSGNSLRRALVQPALKCGYRFEGDSMVDEMVEEVSHERGALPLLAFAASRLWSLRDRDTGLLTREAYDQIGGVGGALAQHAEATLEKIGQDRIPIVRELFRNLVTAQGTRVARDRDELLSVFDDGSMSAPILDTLIDARLLTSYEISAADEENTAHHRIEIIHESLLSNWPRLVRWQTQDQEGAQLRDELRHQARVWEEKDQPDDLLWTGTSYKEYELWRERYPGGLTTAEEEFARAMTAHAERQKRRRRIVLAAVIAVLAVGLTVVGGLWRQADLARRQADAEALRAEAGKLLALGEVVIDSYPTAALAWATKSLELADSSEGRKLALRALGQGPPVTVLPSDPDSYSFTLAFSPNGEWLAAAGHSPVVLHSQDGREHTAVGSHERTGQPVLVAFAADDVLVSDLGGDLRWWSVPHKKELRRAEGDRGRLYWPRGDGYFSFSEAEGQGSLRWWPFVEGASRLMGSMPDWWATDIDPSSSWLAYSREKTVYLRSLEDWSQSPRVLGAHSDKVAELAFHPGGEHIAAIDKSGEIRIWPTVGGLEEPVRVIQAGELHELHYDATGSWLAAHGVAEGHPIAQLWDLSAPQGAEPLTLPRTDEIFAMVLAFHPTTPWLVTNAFGTIGFWPLAHRYPWTLSGHQGQVTRVAFTPDSDWLISAARDGVRVWPLRAQNQGGSRVVLQRPLGLGKFDMHPSGEHLAVATVDSTAVLVVPLAGGPARELPAWAPSANAVNIFVAFSPGGRFLAAVPAFGAAEDMVVRVWDLVSGDGRILGSVPGDFSYIGFVDEQRVRWIGSAFPGGGSGGHRVFNLQDGSVEILSEEEVLQTATVSRDGSFMMTTEGGEEGWGATDKVDLTWRSLETDESRRIDSHGDRTYPLALDPTGKWIVTGSGDGVVRVGPVSGEEPHLFYGHSGFVRTVDISPDGRWIASGGDDGTVRLWPMPDLSQPPFHTRPLADLLATLYSLTNLRVVEAADSATGWKVEIGPFPGWQEVPSW